VGVTAFPVSVVRLAAVAAAVAAVAEAAGAVAVHLHQLAVVAVHTEAAVELVAYLSSLTAAAAQSALSGPVRPAPSHRLIQGTYKCLVIPASGRSPNSFKVAVRGCGLWLRALRRLARLRLD
jgi:hypothetical protein